MAGAPRHGAHNPISQSFAQDLATREGQRPRCPCGGESGSGDAAPPGEAAKRPMTKTKTPHDGGDPESIHQQSGVRG